MSMSNGSIWRKMSPVSQINSKWHLSWSHTRIHSNSIATIWGYEDDHASSVAIVGFYFECKIFGSHWGLAKNESFCRCCYYYCCSFRVFNCVVVCLRKRAKQREWLYLRIENCGNWNLLRVRWVWYYIVFGFTFTSQNVVISSYIIFSFFNFVSCIWLVKVREFQCKYDDIRRRWALCRLISILVIVAAAEVRLAASIQIHGSIWNEASSKSDGDVGKIFARWTHIDHDVDFTFMKLPFDVFSLIIQDKILNQRQHLSLVGQFKQTNQRNHFNQLDWASRAT